MTIPDFETLLGDRVLLCLQDLQTAGTLARVLDAPPTLPLTNADYPCAYPLFGEMPDYVPANSAGSITIPRILTIRVEVRPIQNSTETSLTSGNDGYKAARAIIAPLRTYFIEHPLLQTTTLPALTYVFGDIGFRDSGITQVDDSFAVDFSILVNMRARVTTTA